MGRIEDLAARYRGHIAAPWQRNLAGDQKAIFVVYPKTDERRLRARLDLFEMATTSTGHRWRSIDLTDTFARWMAETDYRDAYFEEPETISMKLRSDFVQYAAGRLRSALTADGVDWDRVLAYIKANPREFEFERFLESTRHKWTYDDHLIPTASERASRMSSS